MSELLRLICFYWFDIGRETKSNGSGFVDSSQPATAGGGDWIRSRDRCDWIVFWSFIYASTNSATTDGLYMPAISQRLRRLVTARLIIWGVCWLSERFLKAAVTHFSENVVWGWKTMLWFWNMKQNKSCYCLGWCDSGRWLNAQDFHLHKNVAPRNLFVDVTDSFRWVVAFLFLFFFYFYF